MSQLTVTPPRGATVRAATPGPVLAIVLLGGFIAQSSYFLINIALPSISVSLGTPSWMLQLITAAYTTSFAGLLIAGGRLGDRFGRRRMFVLGLIGFAVASVVSGLSVNGWMLAFGRLLQGGAAAALLPQILGTIQATYEGQARQRALGFYAACAGLALVLGQLLGGVGVSVSERYGWRTLLFGIAVAAVAVGVIGTRALPETRGAHLKTDGWGAALLMMALGLFLVPLSIGPSAGWPLWTRLSIAIAIVVGVSFVLDQRRRERHGNSPLLPVSMLAMPPFRLGLVSVILFFGGIGPFFLVTALMTQTGMGMSALTASVVLAPYAVVFLGVSLLVPRLMRRLGTRVIAYGAMALVLAYGLVAMAAARWFSDLATWHVAALLVVVGVAQALVVSPLFGAVLSQLPIDVAGFAGGVMATAQQVGLSLGVGAIGSLFLEIADTPDGWGNATAVALATEAGLAALLALVAWRLTRPSVVDR